MAFSFASEFMIFIAALILVSTRLPAKADIRVVNQCPYDLTVCYQYEAEPTQKIRVSPGLNVVLDLPIPWTGSMWASQDASIFASDATLVEFAMGQFGSIVDNYDVSVVNAYNEAVMINPVVLAGGAVRHALECKTVFCAIPDLTTVCKLENVYGGPSNASCINTNGPGKVDTPSTNLFRDACPGAYVQSTDGDNLITSCSTGSNYDVIWCL